MAKMRSNSDNVRMGLFVLALFLNMQVEGNLYILDDHHEVVYSYESSVKLKKAGDADEIGYDISGAVSIATIWNKPPDKILKIQVSTLSLLMKPDDSKSLVRLPSNLEKTKISPFFLLLKNSDLQSIYIDPKEDVSLRNIKKAISSLLQVKLPGILTKETDVSGECDVFYKAIDSLTTVKEKSNCINNHLQFQEHSEKILGTKVSSIRRVIYKSLETAKTLDKIKSFDQHEITLNVAPDNGIIVTATQEMKYSGNQTNPLIVKGDSVDSAIKYLLENYSLKVDTLEADLKDQYKERSKLKKLVVENKQYFKDSKLGTMKSASAFLSVVNAARIATEDDIIKVIHYSKKEKILNQVMDILGASQTMRSFKAILKTLDFYHSQNIDAIERYLWALSVGTHFNSEIITELLTLWKSSKGNNKVKETLLLTIAAITEKYKKFKDFDNKIVDEVYATIANGLSKCGKDARCSARYLRCMKNLRNAKWKRTMLHYALTGSRISSVAAMKALYSLSSSEWDSDILKAANDIYFQVDKKFDSSCRTIALDIILESKPSQKALTRIILSLVSEDKAYEVKKYLLERLYQLSSTDERFKSQFEFILRKHNLYHYGALAQRGKSNALSTTFFQTEHVNVTLHSINEIFKNLAKRTLIKISLHQLNDTVDIFSMAGFTSGLSSFAWSEDSAASTDLDEPEETTGGMELSILGVQIRPFVFFSGHAELMGHAISGTASERTPIFSALTLLHDHQQRLITSSGAIVNLNLQGASSIDLAGSVQFSIWNRNAHSAIEGNVGIQVKSSASIFSHFTEVDLTFEAGSDFSINIDSDLEFGGKEILFCLRLMQLDAAMKYNTSKLQLVRGTPHKFTREDKKSYIMPGRTYALSRINNENCNAIFNYST